MDEKLFKSAGDLPRDLPDELEQASARGDSPATERIIEQICSYDTLLADALKTMADNFDYDRILESVKKIK